MWRSKAKPLLCHLAKRIYGLQLPLRLKVPEGPPVARSFPLNGGANAMD
jgi:hypothetical protein